MKRLVTRKRPGRPAITEARYHPDDTPYPYKDCRKALKQTAVVAEQHGIADREERAGAQVDLLRMALETIAANWVGDDQLHTDASLAQQRLQDQSLARSALRYARTLDDDRTKQRAAGLKSARVGKR